MALFPPPPARAGHFENTTQLSDYINTTKNTGKASASVRAFLLAALALGACHTAAAQISEVVTGDSKGISITTTKEERGTSAGAPAIYAAITSSSSSKDIIITANYDIYGVGHEALVAENSGSGNVSVTLDAETNFRYIPGDEVTKPDCMVTLKGNGEISLANHASFISATSASAIKVEGASLFRFENTKTIMSAGLNPDPFVDISARSVDVTLAEGSMLGGVTGEILRVGSIATYGIVRNAGLIQTGAGQTAVNILGSNIRLELLEGGRITGNVVLAGNVGNSLFAGAGSDRVNGGVVAAGCDVVLEILSGDSYGSLSASGNIDIGGSNLILDMSAADLDVGDSLTLVSAGAGITGSFVGLSDGDVLTLSNSSGVIYELLISVGSSGISAKVTSVVPEPSHIAALLGAIALALSVRRKRNRN